MKNFTHPLTSREDILRLLLEHSRFQPRVETIPVRASLGRITAFGITALNTLPNSPSSQMDGIAIKSANLGTGLAIDLTSPGDKIPGIGNWHEGREYVFSNTGVGIPEGFDTVVPIEAVEIDPRGRLSINQKPTPGQNVIPPGSMIQTGEVLVPANFQLGPAQLALLAAGGRREITVRAKPRVAIIPTGNELVPAGSPLPQGKNVEFNGIMIEAQVAAMGAEARLYPITPDNPEDIRRVLEDALAWADIVILNGGSSKGTDDRALEVLASIGQILVYEGDFGPGKHTTVTMAGTKPIIGTVGPTIGAEYGVEWFVKPLINKYLSIPTAAPEVLAVELLDDIAAPMPFDFYIRLEVQQLDGALVAQPVPVRGAGLVRQMMANAVLRVPGPIKGFKAGETVEVELRQPRAGISTALSPAVK
ncbi:MAG: molybdopterin molybdotransferase MoeA [Syntrophomonadaceae bacterium]